MRQKLIFVLSMILLLSNFSFAQTRIIRGTVTDNDSNVPLPGVSILIPGTSTGTTTDDGGKFTLNIPVTTKIITLSLVDYQAAEADVTGNEPLVIKLKFGNRSMDEVGDWLWNTKEERPYRGSIHNRKERRRRQTDYPGIRSLTGRYCGRFRYTKQWCSWQLEIY